MTRARKDFRCPKCGGNAFKVNPEAFLMARGASIKNLPMVCTNCGFEAKPTEFSKHKKSEDS